MGLGLVFALLTACAGAKTPSPTGRANSWQDDRIECVRPGYFAVEAWSVAGLRVGVHTVEQVIERLGKTEVIRPSNGEATPKVVCYRFGERVAVFEIGPMGAKGEVTAISLLGAAAVPFVDQCAVAANPELEVIPRSAVPGALRGSIENEGGPEFCRRDATTTQWNFESQSGDWATLTGLKAGFDEGRLLWWRVYRVRGR